MDNQDFINKIYDSLKVLQSEADFLEVKSEQALNQCHSLLGNSLLRSSCVIKSNIDDIRLIMGKKFNIDNF